MNVETRRPDQHAGERVEERVGSALAHRVRVELLTLLSDAVYTADDLAALVGESRQMVHHHLKVLLRGGSIEIAKVEKRRNADLFFYRGLGGAEYSEEDIRAMSPAEREAVASVVVQFSSAEIMAALAAGKLGRDPEVCLVWRSILLDEAGRKDLADAQLAHWARVEEIEAEAANRRARSRESGKAYVVAEWGFERARSASAAPAANGD